MNNKIKTKSAFTLAEVLITLVIIGIVAALTISAVINTYVERSTVSKVKKGLSTLAQAKKLAEVQNGPIEGWDFGDGFYGGNARKLWQYFKPHLSVAKDCGFSTDCYNADTIYMLDGTPHSVNYSTDNRFYKFVLSDGGVMFLRTEKKCNQSGNPNSNYCAMFYYDVNGDKTPNTMGKDIFEYLINLDGVYPNLLNDCHRSSTTGWGCSGYIIKNDNMNYLH